MSKELDKKRCGANVEKVIIDEFVPSKELEALECLERIDKEYATIGYEDFNICFNTIKQALLKAQEQEKVIKVIFEKEVDIECIKQSNSLDEYNSNSESFIALTQEEFDLLKRYFK